MKNNYLFIAVLLIATACSLCSCEKNEEEEAPLQLNTSYWKDSSWDQSLIYSEDLATVEGEKVVEKLVDYPAKVTLQPLTDEVYIDVIYSENYADKLLFAHGSGDAEPVEHEHIWPGYVVDIRTHRFSVPVADVKKKGVENYTAVYITADITNVARFNPFLEGWYMPYTDEMKDILPVFGWTDASEQIYWNAHTGSVIPFSDWSQLPTQRKGILLDIKSAEKKGEREEPAW